MDILKGCSVKIGGKEAFLGVFLGVDGRSLKRAPFCADPSPAFKVPGFFKVKDLDLKLGMSTPEQRGWSQQI